jgi:hypothetical protein
MSTVIEVRASLVFRVRPVTETERKLYPGGIDARITVALECDGIVYAWCESVADAKLAARQMVSDALVDQFGDSTSEVQSCEA